jgi:threonine aldolase
MIAQLHERAKLFAELLPQHGFRILNDVVFNQVVVVCDTPELTQATLAQIQQDGVCWCSGSQWHSEPIIRVSVCSWATTEDDVRLSVEAFAQAYHTVQSS